jgi:LPXTG-motif cell wall-anchored protein
MDTEQVGLALHIHSLAAVQKTGHSWVLPAVIIGMVVLFIGVAYFFYRRRDGARIDEEQNKDIQFYEQITSTL